jgi:hypothetical protein
MKIKTSELEGIALNWAVAKCENRTIVDTIGGGLLVNARTEDGDELEEEWGFNYMYVPSANWVQAGPIIEREKIRLDCAWNPGPWEGSCKIDGVTAWVEGPTPLIAAMRCYVASKLGDEIEIPEELV